MGGVGGVRPLSTTDHVTRAAAGARSARAAVEASHRAIDRDRRAGIWIEFVDRDVEAKGKDSGPVFTAEDEAA